ncbi:MAG: RNA polymerase sigma factor [Lachnospiraceae bacterium]|nr:RNA polymerase sigma factor [Lachnospiraceae bacterium]
MHKNETDIRHILQTHGDALYRSAYLLLGNPHDVQDVLQEVLLRFLEKAPSFNSTEHEQAWLLRVTTNCCMDCLRFRRKHTYTDLDLLRECLPAPEQQAHLEELYALPAKWKSVLILHYFEGYSVAEISKILRLSESAVKKRLQRGREALKLVLSESETVPELPSENTIQTLNKLNGGII